MDTVLSPRGEYAAHIKQVFSNFGQSDIIFRSKRYYYCWVSNICIIKSLQERHITNNENWSQDLLLFSKGICLESRYACSSDFTSPGSGCTVASNYWSNLGYVHQVPITARWTKAVWNTKFTRHFYTWPVLVIEPQTFWYWLQRHNHLATCSHTQTNTMTFMIVCRLQFLTHQSCSFVSSDNLDQQGL